MRSILFYRVILLFIIFFFDDFLTGVEYLLRTAIVSPLIGLRFFGRDDFLQFLITLTCAFRLYHKFFLMDFNVLLFMPPSVKPFEYVYTTLYIYTTED